MQSSRHAEVSIQLGRCEHQHADASVFLETSLWHLVASTFISMAGQQKNKCYTETSSSVTGARQYVWFHKLHDNTCGVEKQVSN